MSAAYDVTVFDGRPVPFMKGDRMRGERDSYLPESFDCAAVMIGHMSEELGRSLGNKNDWYCLCLDDATALRHEERAPGFQRAVQSGHDDRDAPYSRSCS